jgi:type VI protein secretion system component VasK
MKRYQKILNSTASQITAAVLGSLICTVALTIAITLVWPFGDKIEKIFAGGTFFFIFWAAIFYWSLLAPKGSKAWVRIVSILIPAMALDAMMLLGPLV